MLATDLIQLCEAHSGRVGVKRGHNTRVHCPAHDDHHPSLDIAAAADGSALVVCRSHGCSYLDILKALGVESRADNGSWTPEGPGTAVAHYPYQDEEGQLLYEVVKTLTKAFPQRRPDPTSKTGYRWKLGDVRRVLYHLPELVKAVEQGRPIIVVEGEKDADRLRRLGLVATTSPGGAGKWRDDYSQTLRGSPVTVIADRDQPGLDHAATVARSLQRAGCQVTVLQPAVDKPGADVSDHLDAGLSLEELEPLELPAAEEHHLKTWAVEDFLAIPEPPEGYELLGPLVCRGYRTIIVGDTGHGKTSLAFQMLRAIVAGEDCLGQVGAGISPVLIVDLEQGVRSIQRGLRESGLADHPGQAFLTTVPDGLALDQSPEDYAALEQVIASLHPAVVLLDPYYKAHRAEDPNQERPIIDLMRSLDALRAAYGFALILPAHPRKPDTTQRGARRLTIHDVAGSGAATRGAEVVLGIERLGHGSARLRWLKDRDGDSEVGSALPLLYTKERGFWVNTESVETDEGAMAKLLAGPKDTWLTTREWAKEVDVRHTRVKALLEAMAADDSQPVYFMLGPPGRQVSAKCYGVFPEPPEHLGTPGTPDQLSMGSTGVPGVPPLKGVGVGTPDHPQPEVFPRAGNTEPPRNPLLDDDEEEP